MNKTFPKIILLFIHFVFYFTILSPMKNLGKHKILGVNPTPGVSDFLVVLFYYFLKNELFESINIFVL